jgi:cell division protein FtsI (penicillin-binding protein 3)
MTERRLIWLTGFILLWGAAIFLKLFILQVVRHSEYREIARARQELVVEIPAPRGNIFDRTGSPMAMSTPMESVFVNPLRVPDLGVAAEILSRILNLDNPSLLSRMKWGLDNHRGFLWIKRRISFEEEQRLRSLHLEWIEMQGETQRHYPKDSIAAHVLGSVDFAEKGNAGVEKALDAELCGQAGQARLLTDVKRRGIDSQLATEAHAGTPITLSIDERLQFIAERELGMAVKKAAADRGSLVAMNPNSGEILAMASYPTFDPNLPPQPGEPRKSRQNQAVEAPFEPGSVFKVITLSAALETTNLRPETMINCGNGTITLFGRTIHEAKHGYGTIPMAMVLAKSSNIGAIQIGMRVGEANLREYIRRFGFGRKSGIPLPAESGGKVRKVWGKTSLSSVAMGHEISTTTLQLAQACSVIANGGLLVKPRLIVRRGNANVPIETPKRVVKPETAITMRQMMEGVVLHGTGGKARLQGYTSGGKTGSAQIYDPKLGHFTHSYNASFMGFAPVTNPAIVIVVTLNGTHGGSTGFGGAVAAPVFRTVATEALRVLDVPKDLPDEAPSAVQVAAKDDGDDLAIADLGDGEKTIMQEADDEERLVASAIVQGPPLPPALEPVGPKVPNFRGMSMRAVLAAAAAQGLPVQPDGSGIARIQTPPPGAVLRQGERIRVQFAR